MTTLQLEQIHKREATWERATILFFLVFQITATTLIYLNDAQSGFIFFTLVTTFVKSVVIGAVMIELLRFADRLFKKYWLYSTQESSGNMKLISH